MKPKLIKSLLTIQNQLLAVKEEEYNLFNSNGSALLFQYEYAKQFSLASEAEILERKLVDFLKHFQQSEEVTFFGGLSGNIWLVHFFEKKGVIDDLLTEINKELTDFILFNINKCNAYSNYDFLHGSLGMLHTITECQSLFERSFATDMCSAILEGIQRNEKGFYFQNWMNLFDSKTEVKEVNFSLSHGIAAAVIIFSKIKSPASVEATKQLLQYISSYKSESNTISLYPGTMQDDSPVTYNSRLAWCYGDLGIASAFWQAGKSFENEEWKSEAITIMLHASRRRDLKENLVVNAGFCHGTSGIAHIFNRFYKETGLQEFDEARWYWLAQTLILLENENGLPDFKSWQGNKGWVTDNTLLEGTAGIGLVMLGFLSDDVQDLDWDSCLLLS